MRSRLRTGWFLAIIGAVALMGACSLNTQPIPPGVTDFGSGGASDAAVGAPTNAQDANSGDDGAGNGNGNDGGPFLSDDGGDAGDGGDLDATDSGDQ